MSLILPHGYCISLLLYAWKTEKSFSNNSQLRLDVSNALSSYLYNVYDRKYGSWY